jgi:hypothetical protein
MRWFYCHNPACATKQITRWPQDGWLQQPRWSLAAERKLRDDDWPTAAWIRLVDDADRTSEAGNAIAALSKGDDVVMDALGDLPPWEDAPAPAKHWHPVWHMTMRDEGHLTMGHADTLATR